MIVSIFLGRLMCLIFCIYIINRISKLNAYLLDHKSEAIRSSNKHRDFSIELKNYIDDTKNNLKSDLNDISKQNDEFFYFYMIQHLLNDSDIEHNIEIDIDNPNIMLIYIGDKEVKLSKEGLEGIIREYGYKNLTN